MEEWPNFDMEVIVYEIYKRQIEFNLQTIIKRRWEIFTKIIDKCLSRSRIIFWGFETSSVRNVSQNSCQKWLRTLLQCPMKQLREIGGKSNNGGYSKWGCSVLAEEVTDKSDSKSFDLFGSKSLKYQPLVRFLDPWDHPSTYICTTYYDFVSSHTFFGKIS